MVLINVNRTQVIPKEFSQSTNHQDESTIPVVKAGDREVLEDLHIQKQHDSQKSVTTQVSTL